MPDIILWPKIAEFIGRAISTIFGSTSGRWLLRGSPLKLRVLASLFLVLTVMFGAVVWQDVAAANEVAVRALRSPLLVSKQPDTALEAMLLASILQFPSESASDGLSALPQWAERPILSKQFTADIDSFGANFASDANVGSPTQGNHPVRPNEVPIMLNLLPGPKNREIGSRIATDEIDGFLFVPGSLLLGAASVDNGQSNAVAVKPDSSIARDILISQKLAEQLCVNFSTKYAKDSKTETPIFEKDVKEFRDAQYRQSYLIFASGATRICEANLASDSAEQRQYYANKFSAATALQSRPYFVQTIEAKNTSKEYWSEPYIDLGGNGVIRTFCRYLPSTAKEAILCFDFPMKQEIASLIRMQAAHFGASATNFTCQNRKCNPAGDSFSDISLTALVSGLFHPATRLSDGDKEDISTQYSSLESEHSNAGFTGTVTVLQKRAEDGVKIVLVPIGADQVLAMKFDLTRYQWWRSLWLLLAATCAVATIFMAVMIFVDYGTKFEEQERAFNAVDTVMSDVPAPYARVDDDGKFIKVNDAFAKLVGYELADEALAQLKDYTYQEFLGDEDSKQEYAAVKRERAEGQPYRSYNVRLWTGGRPGRGPIVAVKVHGGNVPTPHTPRSKPGQSFGILVKIAPSRPVAVLGLASESEIIEQAS